MTLARVLAAAALAAFTALTVRALAQHGYVGFLEVATANAATGLLFLDLLIGLGLISAWLVADARQGRLPAWPFLLLTAGFGVAGPLLYLVLRPREPAPPAEPTLPRLLLAPVLAAFTAATLYTLDRHGIVAVLLYAGANPASQLLFADLALSLVLLAVGMLRDAGRRGASAAPFILLGVLLGSAGPLLYLLTRGLGSRRQRWVGVTALGLGAWALTLGLGHADLSTETARRRSPDSERRGRELLVGLAERHGLAAWRTHATMEVVARDAWPGGAAWWPEAVQRFRSEALLGTFTSRAELLDGRGRGELWGLQAWAPYKKRGPGAPVAFVPGPIRAITFYLPALQYFNELPFRILSAPIVSFAGQARHRGRSYDLVFATWDRAEASPDYDQYLLWIDRETGLLAKVRYTVRDALDSTPPGRRWLVRSVLLGTMHYEDYREVAGVWVPFVQTVTLPPPELTRYPLREHFFHRLELEAARFDTVPREALLPDPARGEAGDRKPAPGSTPGAD